MHFAAGRNAFVGRIWPAGCSLETPDIEYEEWWEYTPLSESSSTVNGCNLTPSTCTPIVNGNTVTWRPVTDGLQHHRLLLPVCHTPQSFSRPSHVLSWGRQNTCIRLWHVPKISRKFVGVEFCSVVLRPRRKPHWVSSSFGSIISQHLAAVVGAFTPVSPTVYRDDQFDLSVPLQNAMPLDTYCMSQSNHPAF